MPRNRHIKNLTANKPKTRKVVERAGAIVDVEDQPVIIRSTPVCWGIPMDEIGYSKFWTNFVRAANPMPWDGFITTESTYLPDARNTIHKNYVLESDLPYLMMLDSDILFPPEIVSTLMKHNLPIVGGWYRNKKNQNPVIYDYVSTTEDGVNNFRPRSTPGTGIEKVDGMGAGCWLMKREVAVALGEEPYNMNGGGEDLVLCKKLMDLGIPLHVDWNLPLAHVGVFFV